MSACIWCVGCDMRGESHACCFNAAQMCNALHDAVEPRCAEVVALAGTRACSAHTLAATLRSVAVHSGHPAGRSSSAAQCWGSCRWVHHCAEHAWNGWFCGFQAKQLVADVAGHGWAGCDSHHVPLRWQRRAIDLCTAFQQSLLRSGC
jgi:hypothetical protein